jgi:hypothetical protein
MDEFEEDLSPLEVETFQGLAKEKSPPDLLEHQVVRALRKSRLIRTHWTSKRWVVVTAAAATVLVAFGFILGAYWKSRPSVIPTPKPEFLLLLRNSPSEVPIRSDTDELNRVREYSAWSHNSSLEGAVLDGEKLTDDARSLKFVEGQPVVSIADAETRKTAIAGYFLIRARDYQEAIAIAESCPHAKYGGTIEIRQIDSVTRKTN